MVTSLSRVRKLGALQLQMVSRTFNIRICTFQNLI